MLEVSVLDTKGIIVLDDFNEVSDSLDLKIARLLLMRNTILVTNDSLIRKYSESGIFYV